MPKSKFQGIVFGILMSMAMVYGMETYNKALLEGSLFDAGFGIGLLDLVGLSLIVFTLENLYGGKIARWLAFKFVDPKKDKEMKITLAIQLGTISIMCPSMSLVASFLFKGVLAAGFPGLFVIWFKTILVNLPMALTWQLLVAGPLLRFVNKNVVGPFEMLIINAAE